MSDKEQIQQIKKDLKNDYPLIPMNKIEDEARLIAIAWHENATDWIGDKHKLASDIMNYARRAKLRSDEEKDKRIEELEEFVKQFIPDPYPEDIFLPVSSDELKQIHALLQIKFKMPIDRLTGHIGRVLRNPLREQATQLLTKNPQ